MATNEIPSNSAKKDELVQLYQEVVENQSPPSGYIYSSDEEDPLQMEQEPGTKRSGKKPSTSSRKSGRNSTRGGSDEILSGEEISALSNQDLFDKLRSYKVDVGPIVESTRALYERKLHKLMTGQEPSSPQNGVDVQNGVHNGLDKFSADEETEDDDQPAPVVTKSPSQKSTKRVSATNRLSDAASSLRKRFTEAESPSISSDRFTPTPRRSIHSYKVTETSKHTKIKSPDGNISHDYSYTRTEEEDDGSLMKGTWSKTLLTTLPKVFMIILLLAVIFYTMKVNGIDVQETLDAIKSYFQTPLIVKYEEVNHDVPTEVRDDLEDQPSIANI